MSQFLQKFNSKGINATRGSAPGAKGLESFLGETIENGFGQNASSRVMGAKKKDMYQTIRHLATGLRNRLNKLSLVGWRTAGGVCIHLLEIVSVNRSGF